MKNTEKRAKQNIKSLKKTKGNRKKNFFFQVTEIGENEEWRNETLLEYSIRDYDFQKEHIPKVHIRKCGKIYLPGVWTRHIEEGRIHYGNIISAPDYISGRVIEKLEDEIDKLIPSVTTINRGEEKDGLIKVDIEVKANGLEKELKSLKRYLYLKLSRKLFREVCYEIRESGLSGVTFRKTNILNDLEAEDEFIVGGAPAAKKIKFKSFIKDFRKLEEPTEVVDFLVQVFLEKYVQKMKNRYRKTMNQKKVY